MCKGCTRDAGVAPLPKIIITKKSQWRKQKKERMAKRLLANGIINPANLPLEFQAGRLKAKKMYCFSKNWPLNPANQMEADAAAAANEQAEEEPQPFSIVRHRDIIAARCIMYKGNSITY